MDFEDKPRAWNLVICAINLRALRPNANFEALFKISIKGLFLTIWLTYLTLIKEFHILENGLKWLGGYNGSTQLDFHYLFLSWFHILWTCL